MSFYGITEPSFVLLDVRPRAVTEKGKTKFVAFLQATNYTKDATGDYHAGDSVEREIGNAAAVRKALQIEVNHLISNGVPCIAQVFDKASSGFASVYTTDLQMTEHRLDSPYGIIGARCSPLPRGRVSKDEAGSASTTRRQRTLLATRRWEELIEFVREGQFWFRMGATMADGEVRRVKPGEKPPKGDGWMRANESHLAVVVFPAVFIGWKGASAFGSFPRYMPTDTNVSAQVTHDTLRKEIESAVGAKRGASAPVAPVTARRGIVTPPDPASRRGGRRAAQAEPPKPAEVTPVPAKPTTGKPTTGKPSGSKPGTTAAPDTAKPATAQPTTAAPRPSTGRRNARPEAPVTNKPQPAPATPRAARTTTPRAATPATPTAPRAAAPATPRAAATPTAAPSAAEMAAAQDMLKGVLGGIFG